MTVAKLQRDTQQRQVILEELKKLSSHPTATELYEIVRKRLPKISLGTIYRNLELLSKDGIIQKIQPSNSKARFDGNPDRHYHVRCVQCGRIDDLHKVPSSLDMGAFKKYNGWKILDYRLEFTGICSDCLNKQRPKSKKA